MGIIRLVLVAAKLAIRPAISFAAVAAVAGFSICFTVVMTVAVAGATSAIPMAAILILAGPVLTRLTPQGFVVMEVQPPVRI